jgi:hypothetical protein
MIDNYKTNTWLIHHHVDGVSDEESLLQLPFEANCLNWILGHIVWRRNSVMTALGISPLWGDIKSLKYKTDSEPIMSREDAEPFTALLADLDRAQQAIAAKLEEIADAALDDVVANDRGEKRVIEHLQGFHWHETYHIGQLEILRAYISSKK